MAYINGKEVLFSPQIIMPETVEKGLKYASGTVEFTDVDNCIFYHNLGIVPRTVMIWSEPNSERENATLGGFYSSAMIGELNGVWEDRVTYNAPTYLITSNGITNLSETSAKLNHRNGTYQVKTGVTYNWLVIE